MNYNSTIAGRKEVIGSIDHTGYDITRDRQVGVQRVMENDMINTLSYLYIGFFVVISSILCILVYGVFFYVKGDRSITSAQWGFVGVFIFVFAVIYYYANFDFSNIINGSKIVDATYY